jgi:nuclear transport factor 2 (NTF2) superfamily protein
MSKFRSSLYRGGSVLGDVEAWTSGSPSKVAKRYARKSIWRAFGRIMRKLIP